MSESVRIRGVVETRAELTAISKHLRSTRPMENTAKAVSEHIDKRTAAGLDYRGHRFEPYSEAYKKQKGQSRVDLRKSGTMLGAKKSRAISPTHGQVFIDDAREPGGQSADMIAALHNLGRAKGGKVREFMNITQSALNKIVKEHMDDPLMKVLKRS